MAKKNLKVFETLDFFGNTVTLYADTWNVHVLDPLTGHPDMQGFEGLVQHVLTDPHEICLSTEFNTGVAYISDVNVGPRPEGVRVLVDYRRATFQKGDTSGLVTTAYSIDWSRYGTPRLDLENPIYKKKKK